MPAMSKVLIVCSTAPTHDADDHSLRMPFGVLANLEKIVNKISSASSGSDYKPPGTSTIRSVVVLPEYYFTSDTKTEREPLSLAEVDKIRIGLQSISKKYPSVLLLPGSVFFEKDAHAVKPQFRRNPLTGVRDVVRPSDYGSTLDRNLAAFKDRQSLVSNFTAKPDVQELRTMTVGKIKDTTAEQLLTTQMKLQLAKKSQDPLSLCKNEAYLLLGGKVVFKHAKLDGFHETALGGQRVFIPGSKVGFTDLPGENTKVGVEICMEHVTGTLVRMQGFSQVNLHLLISAWVDVTNQSTIADGGYLVHASSEASAIGVWRRKGGNFERISKAKITKDFGDTKIVAYKVDRWT
jgi:predicted amidohydrolase